MEQFKLKPEGEQVPTICMVDFGEEHKGEMKIAEIRFDAKIRIFDVVKDKGIETHSSKHPQVIAMEQKFTHEMLEHCDPYIIGQLVLDAYQKLKIHVNKHIDGKGV